MEQIKLNYHVLDQAEWTIYDLSSTLEESIMVKPDKPDDDEFEVLKKQVLDHLQKHEKIFELLHDCGLETYLVDENNIIYYSISLLNEELREEMFSCEGGADGEYKDISEIKPYYLTYVKGWVTDHDYKLCLKDHLEDNKEILPFDQFPYMVRKQQEGEWEWGRHMHLDGSIVSFKALQNQKKWEKEEMDEANQ